MKGSAIKHEALSEEQAESAFQRFAKTMRALVAVPKGELDLAKSKEKRQPKDQPKSGLD
jgi:hypothetical protein